MKIVRLAISQHWIAHFLHEPSGRIAHVPFALAPNEPQVLKAFETWRKLYPHERWKGREGTGDGWVFRSPAFTYGRL